jgi:heme-degrading monooxygenase HmoA
MVVSVLRMPIHRGAEDRLTAAFRELEVFEHARRSGGFRGGRLLHPLAPGEPVLVVAEWDGADDYDRWLENPVRERLKNALDPLVAGELESAVYEPAHEG